MSGKSLLAWNIRTKLLLIFLLISLPASGIIIKNGFDQRADEIREAEEKVLLLVESLAAQQQQIVIGTRQMLGTLAQLPEVQTMDANACSAIFRELKEQYPYYANISAVRPDGSIFASSIPFSAGVNLADRKHIKDSIRTLRFSAGGYIMGRASNVPSISYTLPVLDRDKSLLAIVMASFRSDHDDGTWQ